MSSHHFQTLALGLQPWGDLCVLQDTLQDLAVVAHFESGTSQDKILNPHNSEAWILPVFVQHGSPDSCPEQKASFNLVLPSSTSVVYNVTIQVELVEIVTCADVPRISHHCENVLLAVESPVHDWDKMQVVWVLVTPRELAAVVLACLAPLLLDAAPRALGSALLHLDRFSERFAPLVACSLRGKAARVLQQSPDVVVGALGVEVVLVPQAIIPLSHQAGRFGVLASDVVCHVAHLHAEVVQQKHNTACATVTNANHNNVWVGTPRIAVCVELQGSWSLEQRKAQDRHEQ
mmetsp:Transcript_60053/g.139885  ORF Transcript_60053/g.139885 Transcript_60053/m.139885 type:complete len:290 (+) Transcript_60053:334-1203(+)